jgi:type IV pilus assembly protein PilA
LPVKKKKSRGVKTHRCFCKSVEEQEKGRENYESNCKKLVGGGISDLAFGSTTRSGAGAAAGMDAKFMFFLRLRAHMMTGTGAGKPGFANRMRGRRGFTLVEVIVVLVILAILAAIAIPALTGYIDKARYTSFKADAREMTVAVQSLISEAYADPGTSWGDGTEEVEFFINGHQIGSASLLAAAYNDTDEDIYRMNLTYDHGSVYGLSSLTKLSPFPELLLSPGDTTSFPRKLLITRSGQIVASLYSDPSSFKSWESEDSFSVYVEGICYTYNADIVTGDQIKYAPGAGYRLFKLSGDYENPEITQL